MGIRITEIWHTKPDPDKVVPVLIKKRRDWSGLIAIAALLVFFYTISTIFKTGIEVGQDMRIHPEKYAPNGTAEGGLRVAGHTAVIFVCNVIADFDRLVFQNLLKGNIPGTFMAAFDNMSPFSNSYEYSITGEPPPPRTP